MKIRVRHVVGVVMAGGALVVAGCGDDARVDVGADSAGPVRSSAPPGGEALTKVALDADAPGRVWRLPLPANAHVARPEKRSDQFITDPAVQLDQYREFREQRAERERTGQGQGATGVAGREQPPMPRSRTLVEVSSTYIEVEGLGVVTVGLLKADLYTSELTDAAVASVPGLTAETIGGRKIEVATADGNPATFCWNQSRHESFCVGGDMLADGNGAVDRLDNISRAIVGAIAATK